MQEHINLLRAEIEKLKAVEPLMISNEGYIVIDDAIKQRKRKLAALEAQAAAEKADPFQRAKEILDEFSMWPATRKMAKTVLDYVDQLKAENKRLEAELAKRPVVYVLRCARTGEMVISLLNQEQVDRRKRTYGDDDPYTYEPYTGQQS
jgi:hypothetical protein